jgi:hypothetical protein
MPNAKECIMTTPTKTAIAIARQISERKPTTSCALGQGLHEAAILREAKLLQNFCEQLGIDPEQAKLALENDIPLFSASSAHEETFA